MVRKNKLLGGRVKVICVGCEYTWLTASTKLFVTCPNCMSKTANKCVDKFAEYKRQEEFCN